MQGTPKPVITGELWRVVSDWIHPEEEMVAYRSVPVLTHYMYRKYFSRSKINNLIRQMVSLWHTL